MIDSSDRLNVSVMRERFEKLKKEVRRLCRLFNKNHLGCQVLHLVAKGKMSAEEGAEAIRRLIAGKRIKLPPL